MPRWLLPITAILLSTLWGCGLEFSSCTSESTDLWLYCSKTWTCDHGVFKVKCSFTGNGGVGCTCKEGDEEVGYFETVSACDDATLSDYNVSRECGWTL